MYLLTLLGRRTCRHILVDFFFHIALEYNNLKLIRVYFYLCTLKTLCFCKVKKTNFDRFLL